MISLDRCNGRCNTVDHLNGKTKIPSKINEANVKVLDIIGRVNE